MVAVYHLGQMTVEVVPHGYLAVDFLFMLSGFVIAHSYQARLAAGMSFARFAVARFIRVYPMYLFGLLISIPVLTLRAGIPGSSPGAFDGFALAANLAMLPSPLTYLLFPLDGALWSLFIEMLVSLAFGAFLHRFSDRTLIVIMALSAALLIFVFVKPDDYIDMGWSWSNLADGIARAGFGFPLGMLMYRRLGDLPYRQSSIALAPFVILGAVMLMAPVASFRTTFDLVAIFLILPTALWIGVAVEPPAAFHDPCARLGDLSYPAYAIHSPLVVATAYVATITGWDAFGTIALFLTVLCLASYGVARSIDAPTRSWLHARWKRMTVADSSRAFRRQAV